MSYPRVAIIILNWNGIGDTSECLESLKKLDYPNYRVIVVDNGSKGNDVQALEERFGDYVHIIENNKNYGFAEGNNIGIRYALTNLSPHYVLILNNDTVSDPAMLTELVKVAESDVSVGLVGPQIDPYSAIDIKTPGGNKQQIVPRLSLVDKIEIALLPRTSMQPRMRGDNLGFIWLSGCALLIKRTVIEKIGLLYSGYFAYYEDTEYCFRCAQAGFKLIGVPTALLRHKVGASTGKTPGFAYYFMTRNRLVFVARNSKVRRLLLYLVYFVFLRGPLTVGYFILRNDPKSLSIFCRGVCGGMRIVLTRQYRQ